MHIIKCIYFKSTVFWQVCILRFLLPHSRYSNIHQQWGLLLSYDFMCEFMGEYAPWDYWISSYNKSETLTYLYSRSTFKVIFYNKWIYRKERTFPKIKWQAYLLSFTIKLMSSTKKKDRHMYCLFLKIQIP